MTGTVLVLPPLPPPPPEPPPPSPEPSPAEEPPPPQPATSKPERSIGTADFIAPRIMFMSIHSRFSGRFFRFLSPVNAVGRRIPSSRPDSRCTERLDIT